MRYFILCAILFASQAKAEQIFVVVAGRYLNPGSAIQMVTQPFGTKPVCTKSHPSRGCLEVGVQVEVNKVVPQSVDIVQPVQILSRPGGWLYDDPFFSTQTGTPAAGTVAKNPSLFSKHYVTFTRKPSELSRIEVCIAESQHDECERYEPKCLEEDEGFCVKYSANASDASCSIWRHYHFCDPTYRFVMRDDRFLSKIPITNLLGGIATPDDIPKMRAVGVEPVPLDAVEIVN